MDKRHKTAAARNQLLAALESASHARLDPYIEHIEAKLGDAICEAGGLLHHAYFPDGAVLSLMTVLRDGSAIETANIGREGAFGIWVAMYSCSVAESYTCFNRCIVQLPGALLRVPIDVLRGELEHSADVRNLFVGYSEALVTQIQQTVACNALHTTQQRICRWLLMMHDRAGGEYLTYTHEFLAQILGANRKSVTLAAQALQRKGLIGYRRGRMQVLDRAGLEKAACECYAVIRNRFDEFLHMPLHSVPPSHLEPRP